jgi:prepilin-type N-terminal cleavage/methylation domain-containing protein
MNRRGFTLIELLIGLVLVSLLAGAIYQLLVNNQQLYRQQVQRSDLNSTLRGTVAILPAELRELDAGDPAESDILAMTATAVTFKAMRTLQFLCAAPVDGGTSGSVTVWRNPAFGVRPLDPTRDSVLVFAEGDPETRADNQWVHANVSVVAAGTACPGGAASATLTLTGVAPSGGLGLVLEGAPVRGFEVEQVLTYTDALGDAWLGARQSAKGSWSTTQPLLGPLAAGGLQFAYFDSTGAVTAVPADVARIGISVSGMTREPVRSAGHMQRVVDSLTTQVALRNNPR